jgi:hypothetical protein
MAFVPVTTVGNNLSVGIDNNINNFFIQFRMISSFLEERREKEFRLIASFTRSSPLPASFYTLEKISKKRREQSMAPEKSVLMETQTELVSIPFFLSLALLNNNNSILQLSNEE